MEWLGLQDAWRHSELARSRRHPAVVPCAAEEAAQRRADACAAGHLGCRCRGRAGGLRDGYRIQSRYFTHLVTGEVAKNMIQAFFFDLEHRTVVARGRGHRRDPDRQDRCAGRGDDGRRYRLRVGQGGLRRCAEGREHRGRREAQATRRSSRPRRSSGARPPRTGPSRCSLGSPRRAIRPTSRASTS